MPSGSPTSGVGRVLAGRYLLLGRLGSGGMGHVWLAHDQKLDNLADVRGYAVVPSDSGFEAAGRRTACLLLGGHGPMYGPIGDRRRFGTAFPDIATMQRRDCLDVRSNRDARLVPCGGPHDEVVLGFARLGRGVTLAEARTASDAAWAREVPPRDYGFDPSVYEAGSWTSEGPWKSGTHIGVCTVRKQNGGTMEGTEP